MADTLEERLAAVEAATKLINERLSKLIEVPAIDPNPDVADLRLDVMIIRTELSAANLAMSKELAAFGQRLAVLGVKLDALPHAIANHGP